MCLCHYVQASCPVIAGGPFVWRQKDDISWTFFVLLFLYVYSFLLVPCSRRPFLIRSLNCFIFFWQTHFPSTSPNLRPEKHPICHLFLPFFLRVYTIHVFYFLFSAKYFLCISLFLFAFTSISAEFLLTACFV